MAFQPVTDACQVKVQLSLGADVTAYNVFGHSLTTTLTQTVADNIAIEADDLYGGLLGKMADNIVVEGVWVTDLRTEGAPEFFSIAGSFPQTGTAVSDPLPLQTAALISWATDLRGRSYRGRTYLCGFAEGFSDGRSVDAALVASAQAAANAIVAYGTWGVISRYHDKVLRTDGELHTFTSGLAHDRWVTQRRRAHPTL